MSSEDQHETTVDKLPDEMLLKIFEAMDSVTLKNSCLVCERWEQLIGSSLATMKKLPLALEGSWLGIFQNISDFNRKFHTIKLRNMSEWDETAVKVLDKCGAEIRLLTIRNCVFHIRQNIRQIEELNKIFQSFTKLEKLHLRDCIFYKSASEIVEEIVARKVKPINLPHLKSVVLIHGHVCLLEFIKTSQLSSLKIYGLSSNQESDQVAEYLMNFLAGQKALQELALCGVHLCFGKMSIEEVKEIPFKLKRLSLKMPGNVFLQEQKLLALLNNAADTLEELELTGEFPNSVYELIFRKFVKLKFLKVLVHGWPQESIFYHNLRPNQSVQKLILAGFYSKQSVEGIIGNLPSIDKLSVDHRISQESLLFVSNNLLKLEHLHFELIGKHVVNENSSLACMRSVKSISIVDMLVIDLEDWKKFVEAFPNVEKFSVSHVHAARSLSDKAFNIFTKQWKNLRDLKLGKGFIATKRIFNILLRNCKQIKTVELIKSAFKAEHQATMISGFKKDGLRLLIHEDIEVSSFRDGEISGLWANDLRAFSI